MPACALHPQAEGGSALPGLARPTPQGPVREAHDQQGSEQTSPPHLPSLGTCRKVGQVPGELHQTEGRGPQKHML